MLLNNSLVSVDSIKNKCITSSRSATGCTFDVTLVDDPLEQGLLVHAAPVHPVPKCVFGHDPVDMGGLLLPKPEDARNGLRIRTPPLSVVLWHVLCHFFCSRFKPHGDPPCCATAKPQACTVARRLLLEATLRSYLGIMDRVPGLIQNEHAPGHRQVDAQGASLGRKEEDLQRLSKP